MNKFIRKSDFVTVMVIALLLAACSSTPEPGELEPAAPSQPRPNVSNVQLTPQSGALALCFTVTSGNPNRSQAWLAQVGDAKGNPIASIGSSEVFLFPNQAACPNAILGLKPDTRYTLAIDPKGATPRFAYTFRTKQTVSSFSLIDATFDQPYSGFGNVTGSTTFFNLFGRESQALNLQANTQRVGSVQFKVNGTLVATDNSAPYALCADTGGNFPKCPENVFGVGDYTVEATPFRQANAKGQQGDTLKVEVVVVNTDPTPKNLIIRRSSSSVTLCFEAAAQSDWFLLFGTNLNIPETTLSRSIAIPEGGKACERFTGLTPNTLYQYKLSLSGFLDDGVTGQVRTRP